MIMGGRVFSVNLGLHLKDRSFVLVGLKCHKGASDTPDKSLSSCWLLTAAYDESTKEAAVVSTDFIYLDD